MSLPLEHRFTFRDQSVAWGVMGSGPPLVLVHGFPWSAQAWRKIAPWLADTRTVHYFDMLGCGQSAKGEGQDVTEPVQSDLLEALLAHWQLERPEVVAHDFGGLAALRAHFINGIDLCAMHLVDPVAILPSGSAFYAHVAEHEAAFAGLPEYAHEALFQAYIQKAAYRPLSEEAKMMYATPWRGELGQGAFYRQIAQSGSQPIEEVQRRYARRNFPVHLIWGEQDTFIPVERGEALREALEADSFTRIADAGHLVHEDAPAALLGALMRNILTSAQ